MTSDEKGRAYWNLHSKNYDRSMALIGRPIPKMVELAAEAVRGVSRVLEVAAGTGMVTPALAREAREVIATDYAPAMVAALEARVRELGLHNVRCEPADLYALRFERASFDAVVAANVLHLVPDLPGALAALRGMLKPGGCLIVPTFCHDETVLSAIVSRLVAITGFPAHRRFTVRTLHAAMEAAGMVITRTETLDGPIPIGYVQGTFGAT